MASDPKREALGKLDPQDEADVMETTVRTVDAWRDAIVKKHGREPSAILFDTVSFLVQVMLTNDLGMSKGVIEMLTEGSSDGT